MNGGPLRFLGVELGRLEREGLLRSPDPLIGSDLLVLCSNDYLGYAADPWPWDDDSNERSGAGASRLVSGSFSAHVLAERAVAEWLGTESALLFSSGFAANVGVVGALAGRGDLVVSDALNHASIIDGCRLSGATVVVVPHCDAASVDEALRAGSSARRRFVVTESYFSMDGDVPDLAALRAICDRHDAALLVDEAHALGVFGPSGRGLCAEIGVVPDVVIGTLGKAIGLQGAFVAGSQELRTFLWNRARSFVFSTGVSPALARVIVDRVHRTQRDEAGRRRLTAVSAQLREGLSSLTPTVRRELRGPIIPWVLGSPTEALRVSSMAREKGLLVQAIRPPTVPPGTARLRVTATATLTDADIERALRVFAALLT